MSFGKHTSITLTTPETLKTVEPIHYPSHYPLLKENWKITTEKVKKKLRRYLHRKRSKECQLGTHNLNWVKNKGELSTALDNPLESED